MQTILTGKKAAFARRRPIASPVKKAMSLLSASVAVVGAVLATSEMMAPHSAQAQITSVSQANPDAQLLLKADQLVYDNDAEVVTAIGNVQLDYDGYNVVANRVAYDQKTRRVRASGNVEIIEPDGNRIYADEVDITDDFGQGFVNALRIETPDNTRFAAESAERFAGQKTVFNHGVYTACEPCKDRPEKPPIWQVKAEKIILDGKSKTVTYEHARFELFGRPIAYLPWFRHADPNTKRKTGLLTPEVGYSDELGVWYRQPYFIATGESHDLTLKATGFTRQGVLADAEWRHQLESGLYSLRAVGIQQLDSSRFDSPPDTTVKNRGLIASNGSFNINPRWSFGWDVLVTSDATFPVTYEIDRFNVSSFTNQAYLKGLHDKSFFKLSAQKYEIQGTNYLVENQQAKLLPVLDYNYVKSGGYSGGEVSLDVNVTNIDRSQLSVVTPLSGDIRTHGTSGDNTRVSADLGWKKTATTAGGLMLTPSLAVRGDWSSVNAISGVGSELVSNGDAFRFMPTAALEARYPLLFQSETSSHIVEPIAQVLARPDLSYQGILPNEDAQSLVFEASNLFEHDKFSGYDRIESGFRANIGIQYSGAFQNGLAITGLIGQSFHLGGRNPFARENDLVNAGENSGLETDRSDLVASLGIIAPSGIEVIANARFDEQSLDTQRVETRISYGTPELALSTSYTYIAPQPDYAFARTRQQVSVSAGYQFKKYWRIFGSASFDIQNKGFISDSVGLSYSDECFTFSLAFSETRSRYSTNEINRSVTFRVSLRTIGEYDGQYTENQFNNFSEQVRNY